MREGDKDGVWGLVKDGMRYVAASHPISSTFLSECAFLCSFSHNSTAVLYEHVPWLGYYTRNFPTLIRTLIRLRQMAAARTTARYNNGSKVKDLFYYLVSHLFILHSFVCF